MISLDSPSRKSLPQRLIQILSSSVIVLALPALASANRDQLTAIPGSVRHPDVTSRMVIPATQDESVHFAISLQPRDMAGLQWFADQVSNPNSLMYRRFISPEEVGRRFGPSQQDIDSTVNYLKANGIAVTDVAKNGLVISAEGPASNVSSAFHTQLAYVGNVESTGLPSSFRTNLTPLQMPSSLANKVVSIDGIDTSITRLMRANTTQLNPTTFRAAYNAATQYGGGFQGQGVHIAIANWDGYRLNNVPYFTSAWGLPVPAGGSGSNITVVKVGTGTTYGVGSPQGEGDLDIQAELSAAPLANIYIYDDSTNDTAAPITTLSKISSDNIADVVSESYGWETSSGSTYYGSTWTSAHNIHLSLTSQGITYLAATGDNGTGAFPKSGARYGYPDIDPEVLNVGGSIMTVNSTTGARVSEASWGLASSVGGTGGFDPYDTSAHGFAFNTPPTYQSTYISSKTSTYKYRLLPDVAAFAGGQNGLGGTSTGWAFSIFYNSGTSYPLGSQILIDGTSIASPAVAGGLGALIGEVFSGVTPNASRSNVRFGRIQDYLYSVGTNATIFNDITTGSSIGNLPGTTIAATPAAGWDYATGWGSINFGGLYSYIKSSGKIP